MQKIKGILFDFDGTLIDTMFHFQEIAGRVIHRFYPSVPVTKAEQLYLETSGLPFEKQMELIQPGGEKNAEAVRAFEEEKLKGIMDEKFDPDVQETFEELKEEGYRIGISSGNYTSVMKNFLEKEPLPVDVLMGFEPGFEKGKDHFEHFLKKTGLKKEEILFVGDSIKDGERALNYGVPFIGKEGIFSARRFKQEFGPDQPLIRNISEIKDYLG